MLVATTVLVAACCGSVSCECEDAYADAIGFRFSSDPVAGFRAADIDTVFVTRVPRDPKQQPRADTTFIARGTDSVAVLTQPLVINNATPFSQVGNRKLDQYTYTLYLAKSRRAVPIYRYQINQVELTTDYQADGCCTCYLNTGKRVVTTDNKGVSQQFYLTDPAANNQLIPIVLTRR
ncbi:hypothetical protein GCM10011378_11190 [Hymenobacter glacieicola]|uniref:Uncharacterized protein n=1 Tax=Hymenobacter glacieicola TaxID=1562124 RepID=A0ABQ1WM82_9BACT|nr:hypothetical protein GCM10011378_11190 [Hymenobacter glacieicola]